MIKLSTVILANLVLGEDVVPEFLQRDCTADRLAAALLPLLAPLPGSTASRGTHRVPPAPARPPRSWSYAGHANPMAQEAVASIHVAA